MELPIEIIKSLFALPFPAGLSLAGIVLIIIAAFGGFGSWIDLDQEGKKNVNFLVFFLLSLGLVIWFWTKIPPLYVITLLIILAILFITTAQIRVINQWFGLNQSTIINIRRMAIWLFLYAFALLIYLLFDSTHRNPSGSNIEISPKSNIEIAENLKKQGRKILSDKGRYGLDEAIQKFEEAQKYAKQDGAISYYIGWLKDLNYSIFKKGECQNPSERYADTLRLFDENPPKNDIEREMVIEKGHYFTNKEHRNGGHDRAIDIYNKYILKKDDYDISNPVTYLALVSRGMANFWKGKYELSGDDFEKALAEEPSNQVVYNRGSVYAMYAYARGDYSEAITWYKAAIYGGEVQLKNGKIIKVSGESDLDEARRDLGFALLLDKKSKRDPKDRYTEALGEFNEAIEINKNNHDNNGDSINYYAYVGKGIAEFLLRDIETAKLTLGKVPENDLYSDIAKRYLMKIEQCESSDQSKCVDHLNKVTLSDMVTHPILTGDGISRMFGNVTVHEEELDPVLSLEHKAMYKGPCP